MEQDNEPDSQEGYTPEGPGAEDPRVAELQRIRTQLQQEQLIRIELAKILTPQAYDRMANVKLANRNLYLNVVRYLLQLKSAGRLNSRVDDATLTKILMAFSGAVPRSGSGRESGFGSGKITIKHK